MRLERQVAIAHPVGSAIERRHAARLTAQVVMCRLLVVTMLAAPLIIAVDLPRQVSAFFGSTKDDGARLLVRRYALEAFPQWALEHHQDACPRSIDALDRFIARTDAIDPWGTPLELRCGPAIPGAYVRSAGEDRRFGTADDITSQD